MQGFDVKKESKKSYLNISLLFFSILILLLIVVVLLNIFLETLPGKTFI
ncbi:hypothetical protein ACERII_17875 [Evansella sp. AB-rgal1]